MFHDLGLFCSGAGPENRTLGCHAAFGHIDRVIEYEDMNMRYDYENMNMKIWIWVKKQLWVKNIMTLSKKT